MGKARNIMGKARNIMGKARKGDKLNGENKSSIAGGGRKRG